MIRRLAVSLLLLSVLMTGPAWAQTTNQLFLTGANSGSQPSIQANGVDSNISIVLTPKGTGSVGIGLLSPAAGTSLDVHNGIRAGSSTNVTVSCSGVTNEGIERFNYTSNVLEYCNGNFWNSVGGLQTPVTNSVTLNGSCSGINVGTLATDSSSDLVVCDNTPSSISGSSCAIVGAITFDETESMYVCQN
jgi:hypothetical protein